jgi:hypothetical protein
MKRRVAARNPGTAAPDFAPAERALHPGYILRPESKCRRRALWTVSPGALPGFCESSIKSTNVYNDVTRPAIFGRRVIRLVRGVFGRVRSRARS